MACPTCSHTMQNLGLEMNRAFWCPRCGTLSFGDGRHVETPALVERCQQFGQTLGPSWFSLWKQFGIAESINIPEERNG